MSKHGKSHNLISSLCITRAVYLCTVCPQTLCVFVCVVENLYDWETYKHQILHFVRFEKPPSETSAMLQRAYGDMVMNKSQVCEWDNPMHNVNDDRYCMHPCYARCFLWLQGIIHYKFILKGWTVNSEMYVNISHHLRDAIISKHLGKLGTNRCFFFMTMLQTIIPYWSRNGILHIMTWHRLIFTHFLERNLLYKMAIQTCWRFHPKCNKGAERSFREWIPRMLLTALRVAGKSM